MFDEIRGQKVSATDKASKLALKFDSQGLGTRHKYISHNGRYIYHIAIIDYLQGWDIEKRGENFYKVVLKQRKEYKISCVNPDLYKHRFYKFMKDNVIINQFRKTRESTRYSELNGRISTRP